MKKIILLVSVLLVSLSLTACSDNKENKVADSVKFKEEYESLNGVVNEYNGKENRKLEISEDNPIVYADAEDIVEKMNNGESFVVYFGFSSCPWCRSALPQLLSVAEDLDIETIYYVDVKEIRDTKEVNENNEIVTKKSGSEAYYELVTLLFDVLPVYDLKDSSGNQVDAGKRIYAPNIVSVVLGNPVSLTQGTSPKQTDGFMELTDEMNNDSYNMIKETLELYKQAGICTDESAC